MKAAKATAAPVNGQPVFIDLTGTEPWLDGESLQLKVPTVEVPMDTLRDVADDMGAADIEGLARRLAATIQQHVAAEWLADRIRPMR